MSRGAVIMMEEMRSSRDRMESHATLRVVLLFSLLIFAVLAFSESSLRRPEPASVDSDEHHGRHRFLANMATAVGALAALVILAMWFTTWVLTPCEP